MGRENDRPYSIRRVERNPNDLLVAREDVVTLVTVTEMAAARNIFDGALDKFKVILSEQTSDRFTIRIRAVWDVGEGRELHEARISISENIGIREESKPTATALFFRHASDKDYVPFVPKNRMSSETLTVALKELGVQQAVVNSRVEMKKRKT